MLRYHSFTTGFTLSFLAIIVLTACGPQPGPQPVLVSATAPVEQAAPTATITPTLPPPPSLLTICLGQEPDSLIPYFDRSPAARSVQSALFDGPFNYQGFQPQPVIMEKVPSLADGDVRLEAVTVSPGDLLVEASGELVALAAGVRYWPAGCRETSCALDFNGEGQIQVDQQVVQFVMRAGLTWSDGQALTARDSVYASQLANALYPQVRPAIIQRTASYQALDDRTVEWRGYPGYIESRYPELFFAPMPVHAWSLIDPGDLAVFEPANRRPLGWGPYQVEEWVAGDHISLVKNPQYFRSGEGLPHFDRLVFRFMPDYSQAVAALQVGECDLLDESALSERPAAELISLQEAGKLRLVFEPGAAWEHLDFNLQPQVVEEINVYQDRAVRQAVALCLDRQRLAEELFFGQARVMDTYMPPGHPMAASTVPSYPYDPERAAEQLNAAGWLDADNDPATPRLASGVQGVPDGIPLAFSYLTVQSGERPKAAQLIQASLEACGFEVVLVIEDWETVFAPGPEGPIFGRNYQLAQFGWPTLVEPPCLLYASSEIPGPYPEYERGWGGSNITGYSQAEFDEACQSARRTLPGEPAHAIAHQRAQEIFASDLPAIPLYTRPSFIVARPDFCGLQLDPSTSSALWNLEVFDYGPDCAAE